MYWIIIMVIMASIATGLTIHSYKVGLLDVSLFELITETMLWVIIIIAAICIPIEFSVFENKYELQKELYSNISINDNFMLTANVVEINNELFEMQARKERLGEWDLTPARVLNMEPIGIK